MKPNTYYNASHIPDPTACNALNPLIRADDDRERELNILIKTMKITFGANGFDITNRIEIKDRKTGRIFK